MKDCGVRAVEDDPRLGAGEGDELGGLGELKCVAVEEEVGGAVEIKALGAGHGDGVVAS